MTRVLERDLGPCVRSYDFEARTSGDGRTLDGYVAVFNTRTRIPDRNGDFEEEISPGFADRYLRERGYPVMQFDHGKDPRVGTVPIGAYEVFEADNKGYRVRGHLFDNPVVEPVRQAIAGKAIRGMSFRFQVTKGGDRWERRNSGMDLRQVVDADVPEAGPVVFPAYAATSISLRSILAPYSPQEQQELINELRAMAGLSADLTGESTARSGGRGDNDVKPGEGDTSTSNRARALLLTRKPIVLP